MEIGIGFSRYVCSQRADTLGDLVLGSMLSDHLTRIIAGSRSLLGRVYIFTVYVTVVISITIENADLALEVLNTTSQICRHPTALTPYIIVERSLRYPQVLIELRLDKGTDNPFTF